MPKFDLDFYTDTACADTVDPDTKNAEAMPKFEAQLVIQSVSENIEGLRGVRWKLRSAPKNFIIHLAALRLLRLKI